jgi:hypothetical protein
MHRRRRTTSYDSESIVSFTPNKNITKEMIEKAAPQKLDDKAINYIKSTITSMKPHSIITIKQIGEEKKKIKEEKEKEKKSGKGIKNLK